jgi:hypothetical protein
MVPLTLDGNEGDGGEVLEGPWFSVGLVFG